MRTENKERIIRKTGRLRRGVSESRHKLAEISEARCSPLGPIRRIAGVPTHTYDDEDDELKEEPAPPTGLLTVFQYWLTRLFRLPSVSWAIGVNRVQVFGRDGHNIVVICVRIVMLELLERTKWGSGKILPLSSPQCAVNPRYAICGKVTLTTLKHVTHWSSSLYWSSSWR